MTIEPLIRIKRSGEEIGSWDRFQIRQFIASGALVPSDEFQDDEANLWLPLLPSYRRKWNMFDWSDDEDHQWYFIKDGYIHGPRLIAEISALHDAGYLPDDTLIAYVAANEWISIKELVSEDQEEPLEVTAKDHANEAISAYTRGDAIGAGIAGFKAIGRFFKDITAEVPITSEWLCVPIGGDSAPEPWVILDFIQSAGFKTPAHEILGEGEGRILAIQFADIAEATRARDEIETEEVTKGFLLLFHNRNFAIAQK